MIAIWVTSAARALSGLSEVTDDLRVARYDLDKSSPARNVSASHPPTTYEADVAAKIRFKSTPSDPLPEPFYHSNFE